ncbi:MAG: DUF2079 domain-containing protein [Clostridia bacterium]|nr:DUF2079 domain-containing protein [Clostridia bacterium]MBR2407288.1 DUF2079 domain-containing protein [Clostridia bacterium]
MRGLLNRFITFPESPMRLLASWFLSCAIFEILRSRTILLSWGFLLLTLGIFVLFTVVQHLLPKQRFSAAALAVCTVLYAVILVIFRTATDSFALVALIVFAVGIVLFPLMRREQHSLLPRPLSRGLCIGLCIGAAVWFALVIGSTTCLRYLTFSAPNYDFGIFCNMFHNMSKTGLPIVTCERDAVLSHFAVHISPIYYVILPFYMLAPSPLTLQIAQAVVLASGVWPLYKLARHYQLSHAATAAVAFLYALYPALSNGCNYDIHENCFLVPLLLWLFVCYEKQRYGFMALAAVLILSVKEDAAVYVAFFAIYVLLARRDPRRALPLLLGAAAYFATAIWLLKTFGEGAMFGRYEDLLSGSVITDGLLGTLLRDPAYFLELIVKPANLSKKLIWLYELLLPLGALLWTPRGKWSRFLLLLPLLLNLLTQYVYQFDINFQYSFGTLPFLFYLLIQNAADSPPRFRREHLVFSAVTAGLLYVMLVLPSFAHYTGGYLKQRDTFVQMEAILDTVPDDVSVTASTVLLPHLAQRAVIYEDVYHEGDPDTDYVVLDMRPAFLKQSTAYYVSCVNHGYTVVTEVEDLITILKAPEQ